MPHIAAREVSLHHLVEQFELGGLVRNITRAAEHRCAPVVHGVVHRLAEIHQPVGQRNRDADGGALCHVLQGPAAYRTVQKDSVSNIRIAVVAERNHEWHAILDKPQMGDHALRQNIFRFFGHGAFGMVSCAGTFGEFQAAAPVQAALSWRCPVVPGSERPNPRRSHAYAVERRPGRQEQRPHIVPAEADVPRNLRRFQHAQALAGG